MSKQSSRHAVIVGNWKMYKTIEEAREFVETLAPLVKKSQVHIYLAVPFTAIYPTAQRVKELNAPSTMPITIGAQNMNDATEGAFTGEIAATMLTEAGAQFVLLGHSERRHYFHEDDALVNRKVKQALSAYIQPIVCIGETLEQREQGHWEEILKNHLLKSLEGVSAVDLETIILAYEPVWAIGTGKVAEPSDAQAAHHYCRKVVAENWGEEAASKLLIVYGGSVKPENAANLLSQEDIDGLLVGGASLSVHSFSQIIHAYQGSIV